MSYSEDQLWDLLGQVFHLPYGSAQIALVEQVMAHADAAHLADLAFASRMQATTSYVYGGEPARAVVTFSWCVAENDRNPKAYERHYPHLLWHFKYMVSALTRFPEVPLERTYAVLDDMERRWRDTGHSMQAVYAHRHYLARHVGDLDAAEEYYTKWCTTPRDDLSDCVGCDPSSKAWWLAGRGRDEEAVALAEPVLAGTLTCSEQPQGILTNLLLPYVRTGRLDQARDAHRRAYRLHRPNLADLGDVADHIEFCARTGNEARGVEILERHLGWLDKAPSPFAAMSFAAAGALVLRRATEAGTGSTGGDDGLTLHRPAHEDRPATDVAGDALAAELTATALAIAERFDARNQTGRVSETMRETLDAHPLVDHLPLSPTAPRRSMSTVVTARTPAAERGAESAVREAAVREAAVREAAVREAVSVPETAGPDELLDHIEETHRGDRDTGPALAAFDARYAVHDLTILQRARRADARALRLADANELAGAETYWRTAEADYAAAGDAERRQKSLARIGLVLVHTGRVDEGARMVADATEQLLLSTSAEVRCDAATRLAWCLGHLDRFDEAVAALDRVADDVAQAPLRSLAPYAVQRLVVLVGGDRTEEALSCAGATISTAQELGNRPLIARAHGAYGACLERTGDLGAAADQMTAAMALADDPDAVRGLRFIRGNLLARTERAAESLDDLTETVADRTAHGDGEAAAEARHWLAVAYLNLDRLLDAAEVAEEELAYRVRIDRAASVEAGPSNAPPEPASAEPVRYLLATIYQRLDQPDEAIAQLEAIGEECARLGNRAGVGQMDQDIADILDRLDRDDAAAARYLAAADAYRDVGRHLEELHNRRRHARSVYWAHGPDAAEPLFVAAAEFAAGLPESFGSALRWEQAMLDYDAARMLWGADRWGEAVARAHAAADGFRGVDRLGGASDADMLRAEILLAAGQPVAAEAAAREALAELPDGGHKDRIVEVLATALQAQGRSEDAGAIRAQHREPHQG